MLAKLLATSAILALSICPVTNLHAETKVEAIQLTTSVYMLVGKGGNVGVFIGEDGTFMIDDQFAPLSDNLLAAIHALGGDSPRFLINTHYHGDHTGGNENFGKNGALIVSHENVRTRLAEGSMIRAFKMVTPPATSTALPVVTYSSDMHFYINEENVNLVHVPNAHTDGDSFVIFENANVVHAGDIFFNGFFPFIDGDHGGSVKGMIDAADAILAISDDETKIIPGHGPLADKVQLQAYRDMLQTAYLALSALKSEGLTADEAIERKPLSSLDKLWGGGMFATEKWIALVYMALD